MATTIVFDDWLDAAEPCDPANVAGLVEAVAGEREFSGYKAERVSNGKLIVSADDLDLKLILVLSEAERGFIGRIHSRFFERGMSAEVYTAIEHLNARD